MIEFSYLKASHIVVWQVLGCYRPFNELLKFNYRKFYALVNS